MVYFRGPSAEERPFAKGCKMVAEKTAVSPTHPSSIRTTLTVLMLPSELLANLRFGLHSLHRLPTVPHIQTHRDDTAMSVWTLSLLALHLHRVPLKVSTYITEVPVWLQNRVLTTVTVMTLTAKSINLTKNSRK